MASGKVIYCLHTVKCFQVMLFIVCTQLVLLPNKFFPVGRVFANCLSDLGSIPGRIILKILPCLTLSNTRYVSRVKWSNQGKKGVAPSSTPQCSSY